MFVGSGLDIYLLGFGSLSYYILKKEDESSMDIRDYEYIVTIAEQKSITRAAAQLFITQSALTKFLQRTERSLADQRIGARHHKLEF